MCLGDRMNQLFVHKAMGFIQSNSSHSQEELDKIEYGLEGVFLTISKILIIILIGIVFHFLDSVLLTLFFFNILRFFAFGLHAKKSIHCLVFSILHFNVLPYLFLHITFNRIVITSIFLFSFISFLFFAPSDTIKRPLTNKKKRIIRKILSILSLFVFIIIMYYYPIFTAPILCSFIIESILINPISYRILGLSYQNYKKMG